MSEPQESGTPGAAPATLHAYRGDDGKYYAVYAGRAYLVQSHEFRHLVRFRLLREDGNLTPVDRVRDYIDGVIARAYDTPQEANFVRVGRRDGSLYVDLADEAGSVVEITSAGWRKIENPPVRFLRHAGTRPLHEPSRGGDYRQLREFVRLGDSSFPLLIAHLTFMFTPRGPHPLMVLSGEQGVAKSTTAKVVQRLCDPRTPAVRQLPASRRDLVIAASRSWLLSFDNISTLQPWVSDALCTLATGGGYGARTGHTDADETTFEVLRPVVLTGIENFVERDDLRDRCIHYELLPIPDTERVDEETFWQGFDVAAPSILGSLFDLCGLALRELQQVRTKGLPRMADFYWWALAVERAGGWPEGTIEHAYRDQRAAGDVDALEHHLVRGVIALAESSGNWSGTATQMLSDLRTHTPTRTLPADASALGAQLRRLAPLLRRNGVDVSEKRTSNRRTLALRVSPPATPSPVSPPSRLTEASSWIAHDTNDTGDAKAGGVPEPVVTPRPAPKELAPRSLTKSPPRPPLVDVASNGPERDEMPVHIKRLPTRQLRAIATVLHGQTLDAAAVFEALHQKGEIPHLDQAGVSSLLATAARNGLFRELSDGLYSYTP